MRLFGEPEFRRRRGTNYRKNAPIGRGNDEAICRGRLAVGIAKEGQDPEDRGKADPSRPAREGEQKRIRGSGNGDKRPTGRMDNAARQIVTCVPISTTRLGGRR